jgi:signal peptidase II
MSMELMRRLGYATAAVVLAADQVTKALASGGVIPAHLVHNTGASFGIGAGHPVVILLTAVALTAVVALLLARTARPATAVFLGAMLGGAAGNLTDRLLRSPGPGRGAVIDWIHVWGYPATFNLADVAIRVGAAGAIVAALISWPAIRWPAGRGSPRRQSPR